MTSLEFQYDQVQLCSFNDTNLICMNKQHSRYRARITFTMPGAARKSLNSEENKAGCNLKSPPGWSMHRPDIQASWRGEKVKSGGLTVAPYSNSSFTHSKLPAAQASHSGVLPSMLRASTWMSQRCDSVKREEEKKTNWWNRIFVVLTIFCRTYSVLPVHQHPAAAWHTGPVHVCTPHAAGWWSPLPRCLRLHHPRSAAAAGGPCLVQQPHALLTGLSRSQDHGLEECKTKSYKYMVIYNDNFYLIFKSTQCQTVVSIYLLSDTQVWSKLSDTLCKIGTLCTLALAGLTSLHLLLSSHPTSDTLRSVLAYDDQDTQTKNLFFRI